MLTRDPFRAIELALIVEEVTQKHRHDVRNKLSSIRNMIFYLTKKIKTTNLYAENPRVSEFLDTLEIDVRGADELLDRLTWDDSPVPGARGMGTSVKDCIDRAIASSRLAEPSVPFDLDAEAAYILVEPTSMIVALRALIENAAEASPPGGRVRIEGRVKQDRYAVEVTDAGPGVANVHQAMTPSFSTKEGHLGLGLNVARRVAAKHDGDLALFEGKGGAKVSLTVPKAPPERTG